MRLILASSSPYRAALLGRLGLDFTVVSPEIDESPQPSEPPQDLALRLAIDKARAVAADQPGAVVIGSDQVAACGNLLLGKPGNRERALAQLESMSGREVIFHTALAVCRDDRIVSGLTPTRVRLRRLERARLERYVDHDQPFDCAGAIRSEALGISLAQTIESDDPTALVGLPLIRLVELLDHFGFSVP